MHNELDRRVLLGAAGLAGLGAISAAGRAGPLNPPAGAVGSTGKTLVEVEPRTAINAANTPGNATCVYRITVAGGYYLTANTLFGPGKSAIEVAASGVTIDLNGFALTSFGGVAGLTASSGTLERIVVRNGSIVGAFGGAVVLAVPDVRLENLYVDGGNGVTLGDRAVIRGCTLAGCGGNAVTAGAATIVQGCIVSGAADYGIEVGDGSVVESCTVTSCGSTGIRLGLGGVALRCASNMNNSGIYAGGGGTNAALVESCVALGNQFHGIQVAGGVVRHCDVGSNGATGVYAVSNCVIEGCSARQNGTEGAATNANFVAVGAGNRLERNMAIRGPVGYQIGDSSSYPNVLFGNTASHHTLNWSVGIGAVCLVIAAAGGTGFSGDSGGVSPGSSNPWANFTL